MQNNKTQVHTTWNCKYPIVFASKYRRKVFFGEKRREIGIILRQLCQWKQINILEAEVCSDHIHMLLEIPPKVAAYIQNQLSEDKFGEQLTKLGLL